MDGGRHARQHMSAAGHRQQGRGAAVGQPDIVSGVEKGAAGEQDVARDETDNVDRGEQAAAIGIDAA